jgi:hypothetical protein
MLLDHDGVPLARNVSFVRWHEERVKVEQIGGEQFCDNCDLSSCPEELVLPDGGGHESQLRVAR